MNLSLLFSFLLSLIFNGSAVFADVRALPLSSTDSFFSPRLHVRESQPPEKLKGVYRELYSVKWELEWGKPERCLALAETIRNKARSLSPWLARTRLQCAIKAFEINKKSTSQIRQALVWIEQHPNWLLYGPHAKSLREIYITGLLLSLEKDVKDDRTRAWITIDRLIELRDWLRGEQLAQVYKWAGEVAFLQQNMSATESFFRRSLQEQESPELRQRLNAIREPSPGKKPEVAPTAEGPSLKPYEGLDASEDERKLVEQMANALLAGELASAVEDGVAVMNQFPGGTRAQWVADRILDTFFTVSDKTDPKFELLRDRLLKIMSKAKGEPLLEWARVIYNRGFYKDAFYLASQGVVKTDTFPELTRGLALLYKSAVSVGDYTAAEKAMLKLIREHAGTAESLEAVFRLGLLHMRRQEYSSAAAQFERFLVLPKSERFELSARYWLWRSLQKQKNSRADEQQKILIEKFPFSYFGLRAKSEADNGKLVWSKTVTTKVKGELWLTTSQRLAYERFEMLVRSGWLEEAQLELAELPAPINSTEKALVARLWAAALGYSKSTSMINEAWDQDPQFRSPGFVELAFPVEFFELIKREAEKNKLNVYLVQSLIKQESSYNPRAVSTSQAMGLMQLIRPTAEEVAGKLKLGKLKVPEDVFQVERNVVMGTSYLAQMASRFNGHIPLALAAYNAGPTRLERWLRGREDLKMIQSAELKGPESEIWIDELPWAETSFYVKAILRNSLLYRIFDKGEVQVSPLVWDLFAKAN